MKRKSAGEAGLRIPRRTAVLTGLGALLVVLAALVVVARPRGLRRLHLGSRDPLPATVTVEIAELRREPLAEGALVAKLLRGTRVIVVADRGRWLQVRAGTAGDGFLPAESVETDAERESREKRGAKILSFPPVFGVVAEDTDVLLAAFPLAPRAGRLRKGRAIAIHAVDHAYYAFRHPEGGIAFVNSADVDLVPPDPRRPAIAPEQGRGAGDVLVKDLSATEASPAEATPREPGGIGGTSEEVIEAPVLLSKVDPHYPEAARRAGVEGTVVLDAIVGADGRVTDVAVLRGLPLGVSEAAVEAVRRWQYRPARGRAGPVASHKTVRVVFTLSG